jgi:hypothetical protein
MARYIIPAMTCAPAPRPPASPPFSPGKTSLRDPPADRPPPAAEGPLGRAHALALAGHQPQDQRARRPDGPPRPPERRVRPRGRAPGPARRHHLHPDLRLGSSAAPATASTTPAASTTETLPSSSRHPQSAGGVHASGSGSVNAATPPARPPSMWACAAGLVHGAPPSPTVQTPTAGPLDNTPLLSPGPRVRRPRSLLPCRAATRRERPNATAPLHIAAILSWPSSEPAPGRPGARVDAANGRRNTALLCAVQ